MGRLARSWQMVKLSFRVVQQDKELLWLPVLSFLATVVAVAGIAGIGFAAGVFPEIQADDGGVDPVGVALGLASYLALAIVQVFFHAAVVHAANERLAGGDPTVGSALRGAGARFGRLFLWALVVATVNVILQAMRERSRGLGQMAASFAGVAWNLATYFVVPLLMFEERGVGGSLKHSGRLFKKTWGEAVAGEMGMGLLGMLAGVLVVVLGLVLTFGLSALGTAGLIAGIVITVLAVVVVSVMFTVAAAVYKTALYRYATTGHAGGPFQDSQLAHAFHR